MIGLAKLPLSKTSSTGIPSWAWAPDANANSPMVRASITPLSLPGKSTNGRPSFVMPTNCPTQQEAEPASAATFSPGTQDSVCISILLDLTALDCHITAPFDINLAAFDRDV